MHREGRQGRWSISVMRQGLRSLHDCFNKMAKLFLESLLSIVV
jgi:hypothetical protein